MIEVNNLTTLNLDKNFIKKTAKIVLEQEGIKNQNLSIAFIKESQIKRINQKYRKINKITDVLSFAGEKVGEGEIVICPNCVKKNAKKFGITFKEELARVLIHGILHLLCYNHESSKKDAKIMEEKQNYYLQKLWQKK